MTLKDKETMMISKEDRDFINVVKSKDVAKAIEEYLIEDNSNLMSLNAELISFEVYLERRAKLINKVFGDFEETTK